MRVITLYDVIRLLSDSQPCLLSGSVVNVRILFCHRDKGYIYIQRKRLTGPHSLFFIFPDLAQALYTFPSHKSMKPNAALQEWSSYVKTQPRRPAPAAGTRASAPSSATAGGVGAKIASTAVPSASASAAATLPANSAPVQAEGLAVKGAPARAEVGTAKGVTAAHVGDAGGHGGSGCVHMLGAIFKCLEPTCC